MIALFDDTITKFIGKKVFELGPTCNLVNLVSKINRPELYIYCYAFLMLVILCMIVYVSRTNTRDKIAAITINSAKRQSGKLRNQ